jgi:hypothetical protein
MWFQIFHSHTISNDALRKLRIPKGSGEKGVRALDFFAADGTRLSHLLLRGYEVDAWEIRPDLLKDYSLPANKVVGDSFELAKRPQYQGVFDLILVDNYVGCWGAHGFEKWRYCEHFEALEAILPLLADEAKVIFNLTTSPERYLAAWLLRSWRVLPRNLSFLSHRWVDGELDEWGKRRRAYYTEAPYLEPRDLSDYLEHYHSYFEASGFYVLKSGAEKRIPGLYLATFTLKRRRA